MLLAFPSPATSAIRVEKCRMQQTHSSTTSHINITPPPITDYRLLLFPVGGTAEGERTGLRGNRFVNMGSGIFRPAGKMFRAADR